MLLPFSFFRPLRISRSLYAVHFLGSSLHCSILHFLCFFLFPFGVCVSFPDHPPWAPPVGSGPSLAHALMDLWLQRGEGALDPGQV